MKYAVLPYPSLLLRISVSLTPRDKIRAYSLRLAWTACRVILTKHAYRILIMIGSKEDNKEFRLGFIGSRVL